jgi:predicted TIM-barrel fold metal-dependent hydrolase
MALIIDGFTHILPKLFAEEFSLIHPTDELRELTGLTHLSDIEMRIRVMDKYKIDKQVLTLARPSIWMNIPSTIALKMTRKANDAVAKAAKQFPDRFIGVGTLPILSEEFMPEFDRCIDELDMVGIQIFSNIDGRNLDDMEFRSFFAKANSTRTPIWIHPQLQAGWSQEFLLDKIFGWPFDTTLAMARLVFSGIVEHYRDLKIITHHMGGMIPHYSSRIKGIYDTRENSPRANFAMLSKDPLEYFKKFYGDTVLNGSLHAFECGCKFFSPEQIVFATDYPYGPEKGELWIKETLHQINASHLSQAEKDQILGENLQRLYKKD